MENKQNINLNDVKRAGNKVARGTRKIMKAGKNTIRFMVNIAKIPYVGPILVIVLIVLLIIIIISLLSGIYEIILFKDTAG